MIKRGNELTAQYNTSASHLNENSQIRENSHNSQSHANMMSHKRINPKKNVLNLELNAKKVKDRNSKSIKKLIKIAHSRD